MTTTTSSVTDIVNGTIQSIKSVIPLPVKVDQPALLSEPLKTHKIGVLIGLTGDIRGQIIFDGDINDFQGLGTAMFGMLLEGEMLESFAGELGNMIAGNLSTHISQLGHSMDITPPTVIAGESRLSGFDRALKLPITLENGSQFIVVIMLDLD
ncbi:chemotaxis protein CheX [Rossellomorea vietnamensis]|uniref:Chemotaxis protein CheX n=1 Tax=Rossellomorea vietnamensis TaxID=218284 RepID=A0A5D4M372_9BACI|nr:MULTISPECIES: chemotaxis protein CheX [Bacillaceae]TYR96072.1 chemotaxis protein CheX [Rossellomorea vietnamensis]